jgi:hypothetical protein
MTCIRKDQGFGFQSGRCAPLRDAVRHHSRSQNLIVVASDE